MLSIIIPSHNDIYLHKTIDSLLDRSEGDIEIIPVLDGNTLSRPFRNDKRIKPIRHDTNLGMREAINTGVSGSHGEYIMRVDEHCMFGQGYDRLLLEEIEDFWIVTPQRFKLDPIRWEVMQGDPITIEKLIIREIRGGVKKFASVEWPSMSKERFDEPISETMMMQGSCWVMSRTWWDKVIVRLETSGYGTLYQDTTEMVFKTWRAGGRLMVNKKTWYAHKHRDFNRTHNYPGELADASFMFALNLWMPDYLKVKESWSI